MAMALRDATLGNPLWSINRVSWPARLAVKWSVFLLAVIAVCFPYPSRLVRHVQHWRDPGALIEPDAAALAPFVEELAPRIDPEQPPKKTLKTIEQFVYQKIPYAWDWDTWGVADYLPTVTETIAAGREDCDGRAVVAASLMRRFGFNARLVTDFGHLWVKTDQGEAMSPGKKPWIVADEQGIQYRWGALRQVPGTLAYGIAVFPLARDMVLVGVLWLLLLRKNGGLGCNLTALTFLVAGLLILRAASQDYFHPRRGLQILALASGLLGVLSLWLWAAANARRTAAADLAV